MKILSYIFWLFNPLKAVVSSQGNAESTMAVLMLLWIYYLECDQLVVDALLYGMIVYVKIYPVIFNIIVPNSGQNPLVKGPKKPKKTILTGVS